MTRIIDTGISRSADSPTATFLLLGADIQFTGTDLSQGQSGAANYALECIVWDDDAVFNDEITRRTKPIPRTSIRPTTGVEMEFRLPISKLRASEGPGESAIELFGEFRLKKNGRQIGPSRLSRNLDYRFPSGTPVPPGGSGGTGGSPA